MIVVAQKTWLAQSLRASDFRAFDATNSATITSQVFPYKSVERKKVSDGI